MRTASTLVNPGVSLHDEAPWQIDDVDQTPASSYARDLRVVGQLLERRQITSADLVCVADAYIIRGIQRLTGDSRFRAYFSRRPHDAITRDPAWRLSPVFAFGGY